MLPEKNEIRSCLGHFIINTKMIIFKLEELKEDIQKFHLTCNKVKTVGTSVGTIGSVTALACFIAAPFTLGTPFNLNLLRIYLFLGARHKLFLLLQLKVLHFHLQLRGQSLERLEVSLI